MLSNGQYIQSWKCWEKIETLSPNLLSFVVARMCSTIDSGEKGYKLLEQILFNFLVLFPTLIISIMHKLLTFIYIDKVHLGTDSKWRYKNKQKFHLNLAYMKAHT